MLNFRAEQKVFEIGKVRIGGLPGLRATVLIGSIFYNGHKIVEEPIKGIFDKNKAEKLINLQEEYSDKTGNPCMIDVVASSSKAMQNYLNFVSSVTDIPILLDSVSYNIRVEGLKYAKEHGIKNIVYNSIVPDYKQEELESIKDAKIDSAILLAFTTKDFTSKGRISAIRNLLPKVKEFGVTKPIIDACVIDIPSLGSACKALVAIKDEYGLPVGCGAHNAIGTWRGLVKKMGKHAVEPVMASASSSPVILGADFILYGPIESASYVFPSVAMIDACLAQLAIEQGRFPERNHPIFKIG
jgi:tetrahydromethanopterin S-methyltransferase subunit H